MQHNIKIHGNNTFKYYKLNLVALYNSLNITKHKSSFLENTVKK